VNNAVIAFVKDKEDEVVILQPCFAVYSDIVSIAGGKVRGVGLKHNKEQNRWLLDMDEFRAAFNEHTKLFILNTPHNPTGKVFSREEIEQMSAVLKDFPNVIVLADEVYNFLTYDGKPHTMFAEVGDNFNRTLTCHSAGKLFFCTGWKLGWMFGPPELIRQCYIIGITIYDCSNAPAQIAISKCIEEAYQGKFNGDLSFVEDTRANFEKTRDYFVKELSSMDIPVKPVICEGGYFLVLDISECIPLIP
jgi:aspartate/methionine/tyrosine aminotransferase